MWFIWRSSQLLFINDHVKFYCELIINSWLQSEFIPLHKWIKVCPNL